MGPGVLVLLLGPVIFLCGTVNNISYMIEVVGNVFDNKDLESVE